MSIATHPASETLAELLHSTAIRLLRTVRRVDESSGLTAPRLSALSVIVFSGPITLGKLAEAEQVRPPTMTRVAHAGSNFLQSKSGTWRRLNRRTCLRPWSQCES